MSHTKKNGRNRQIKFDPNTSILLLRLTQSPWLYNLFSPFISIFVSNFKLEANYARLMNAKNTALSKHVRNLCFSFHSPEYLSRTIQFYCLFVSLVICFLRFRAHFHFIILPTVDHIVVAKSVIFTEHIISVNTAVLVRPKQTIRYIHIVFFHSALQLYAASPHHFTTTRIARCHRVQSISDREGLHIDRRAVYAAVFYLCILCCVNVLVLYSSDISQYYITEQNKIIKSIYAIKK